MSSPKWDFASIEACSVYSTLRQKTYKSRLVFAVRNRLSGSEHPADASCRTTRKSDIRVPLSLSCAMPSEVSQPFRSGLVETCQSPRLSLLSTPDKNQGPFPTPALPGFLGTTDLSAAYLGPADPSRESGRSAHPIATEVSRVAWSSVESVLSPLLRQVKQSVRFLCD